MAGYPLVFALVGAALAFIPLAFTSYMQLIFAEGKQLIQDPLPEGVPIPRGLSWSPWAYSLITSTARLSSAGVLGLEVGLFCILAWGLLRLLNPTFRMTTGVDLDRQLLTRTYMHTQPLIKAFLIGVGALVPCMIVWALIGFLVRNSTAALLLQCGLIGSALFVLFAREGIAGDYESGNYHLPQGKQMWGSLVGRGAIAGGCAALVVLSSPAELPEMLLQCYRTLGGIGQASWLQIVGIHCGIAASLAAAGVWVMVALTQAGLTTRKRCGAAVPALCVLVLGLALRSGGLEAILRTRFDYEANPTSPPAARLARAAGLVDTSQRDHSGPRNDSVLVVGPKEVVPLSISSTSITGVDTSADNVSKLQSFLQRRGYATSLAETVFKTLHDAASLAWSPEQSLEVDYLNLSKCPDQDFLRLFLEKLNNCRSTEATLRYADLLADERVFSYPDRESILMMGDIYGRLGHKQKAMEWYRRADLTESGVADRTPGRVMFAAGRIRGQLLLNGIPVVGAQVGVMSKAAMLSPEGMFLGPGVLQPFWLRWIAASAVTDARGRFELDHLVAGNYQMVMKMREVLVRPMRPIPMDCSKGDISSLFVGYAKPSVDVGSIDVKFDTRTRIHRPRS